MRKCKRPDRQAIRASCVTIARQPPWSFEAPALIKPASSPNFRQAGVWWGMASPVQWRLSRLNDLGRGFSANAVTWWQQRALALPAARPLPRAQPMRLSKAFLPVLKESPADAQIVSHKLMLRAGLVRQTAAGIYAWLPLGFRVLKKIEQVVREEQDRAGAIETLMGA